MSSLSTFVVFLIVVSSSSLVVLPRHFPCPSSYLLSVTSFGLLHPFPPLLSSLIVIPRPRPHPSLLSVLVDVWRPCPCPPCSPCCPSSSLSGAVLVCNLFLIFVLFSYLVVLPHCYPSSLSSSSLVVCRCRHPESLSPSSWLSVMVVVVRCRPCL